MFDLSRELADYLYRHPGDAAAVELFRALAAGADPEPYGRSGRHGHFTGSSLVLGIDGQRTLLTHHRKLQRWLQPGGHADGDSDLRRVALREACEETGLPGLRIEPAIFDLDRHWIPPYREMPGHWHYDVRFLVRATESEAYMVSDESDDLRWWPLADVERGGFDPSLQRMARRARLLPAAG